MPVRKFVEISALKCNKKCLVARLRPDPQGEVTVLPRSSSWI